MNIIAAKRGRLLLLTAIMFIPNKSKRYLTLIDRYT